MTPHAEQVKRSRTPTPPYCWQSKEALRKIREHLDGDSHLSYALSVYVALTENASDKEAEEFTTLQSHLAALAGGISTRTVRRVLPILREIGVIDYVTPKLRGPTTFQLLSVRTVSPNDRTISPNDRTGTERTSLQSYNRRTKEVTREVTREVTNPLRSELTSDVMQNLHQRLCKLFRRRLTTPWSEKESKAFRTVGKEITHEDIGCIERYYESEREKGDNGIHRRDLQTFLNNFPGELDRARAWENFKVNGQKPKQFSL